MPNPKHIVIFVYIAELVVFAMLLMGSRRPKASLKDNPVALLCAVMFVRILVKMVYFYVEYYVLPWHLDVLFNAVMDITYVTSVILALKLAANNAGVGLPLSRLLIGVACAYVAGLALVSLLWTDPVSNHEIAVDPGLPQILAVAIELAFFAVVAASGAMVARASRGSERARAVVALVAAAVLYAAFVSAWDVSLFVTSLEPLSSIKPFDGVLVYGAAVALIVACGLLQQEATETGQPATPQTVDIDAFAAEHGLTARETEVLGLLFQGLSATQVAERLVVSVNTARRHTYNIYHKVGVSSRYELLYMLNNPGAEIPHPTSENAGG